MGMPVSSFMLTLTGPRVIERTHQCWHGVRRLWAEPGEHPCRMRAFKGTTLLQGVGEL
jgi:hypothetical protein